MSEEYDYPKGEEQGYEGDGPNLRYDDFVGRIVQDPKEPPNVTLLSGFLGSSSEEGHVRLYLDEELSRYVEIPEKAIRHTQELPPEQSALGGSLVWIDRDAEVVHGAAGSERRKATFLEGQIAQDYIGAGGEGPGAEGGGGDAGDGSTQVRECGGGGGIRPTQLGPGCWQSVHNPCIPQTELAICRTRTGIFCTRFGPGCRRTLFEPACQSVFIRQCWSAFYPCVTQGGIECQASGFVPCEDVFDPTIWQQPGFEHQAFAGGGGGAEAQGFAAFPPPTNFCPPTRTISCQSRVVVACFTRFPNECDLETAYRCPSIVLRCPTQDFRCPTQDFRCPTRFIPRCGISQIVICDTMVCEANPGGGGGVLRRQGDIAAGPGPILPTRFCPSRLAICPSVYIRCRTRDPWNCPPTWIGICNLTRYHCPTLPNGCPEPTVFGQCETFGACPSAVDACPTRFGCESQVGCFESVACVSQGCFPGGFEQGGGGGGGGVAGGAAGGGGAQAFRGEAPMAQQPTASPACKPQTVSPGCYESFFACPSQQGPCPSPSAVDACPTRYNCPSRSAPCQSQLIRCQSQLDACPTRYKCPSMASPCITRDMACETRGHCPSAFDACPTRFGCYETQICVTQVCQVSQFCFPQGGGGGFDPSGGGGGFGGGFGGGGF